MTQSVTSEAPMERSIPWTFWNSVSSLWSLQECIQKEKESSRAGAGGRKGEAAHLGQRPFSSTG